MKRFTGYITLCAAMVVGLGVAFIPSVKGINGSADYTSSKEFVFKISDRVVADGGFDGTSENTELKTDDDALDEIIETFESRLDAIQISNYKINKIGTDTISVIYKTDDSFYDEITDYLTFSWSLMASTYGESPVAIGNTASSIKNNGNKTNEFFSAGDATIEYKDNYPYVVIELYDNGSKFKDIYEKAKGSDDSNSSGKNHIRLNADDDSSEEETKSENKIYILNDWLDGYSIKDLVDNKETSNLDKSNYYKHVLFEFDATKPESFFWNWDSTDASKEDNYKKIYFGGYECATSKSDGGNYGTTSTTQSAAYMKSLIWKNIFNSSTYKYQVTLLNSKYTNSAMDNSVSPLYEYLVFMNNVELSTLLIATLCGIVLLLLVYLLNFGVNGLAGTIGTIGTSIITLALFNVLGVEFNLGAIIGIVATLFISLFSTMSLYYKTKKEIYSGKNFKKAYQDGSKKAFWIILDSSIVGLLAGFVAYLIPNTAISSFGIFLIIGSVINLIVNSLITRGVSWFTYNSAYIASKPHLLSLDKKLIPDLTKEEKSKYFESFKTKTSKRTSIISASVVGALLIASIAGMIAFSSINGSILNTPSSEQATELYITQVLPSEEKKSDDYVSDFKSNFDLHFSNDEKGETKFLSSPSLTYYCFSYKNGNTTKYEYTYTLSLKGYYDEDTSTVYYREGNTGDYTSTNIKEAFSHYAQTIVGMNSVDQDSVSIKKVYLQDNASYINYVLIYVAISLALILVYFIIRYGVNKAIVGTILNGVICLIVLGIISVTHISVSAIVSLSILLVLINNALILITFYVGEKEKYKENRKLFKNDLVARYDSFEEINNVDYTFAKYSSLICAFPVIALLFASSIENIMIIMIIFGMVIALPTIKLLSLNGEKVLNKFITYFTKNVKFSKKDKNKKSNDDNGPEEATFIGIND